MDRGDTPHSPQNSKQMTCDSDVTAQNSGEMTETIEKREEINADKDLVVKQSLTDDVKSDDDVTLTVEEAEIREKVRHFLNNERDFCCVTLEGKDETNSVSFSGKMTVAPPLPSPEDKPWKQLPASLLTFDRMQQQKNGILTESCVDNVSNIADGDQSENDSTRNNYASTNNMDVDIISNEDYVKLVNYENTKNTQGDRPNVNCLDRLIIDDDVMTDDILNGEGQNDSIYAVLTDIRFNGPSDNQLMSTSFSESNNEQDEQDWDSGSDTRSSSSGEFIWKVSFLT